MKKVFSNIILLITIVSLTTGCGALSSSATTSSSANNSMIENKTRFKPLNVVYDINSINLENICLICDTQTGLIYMETPGKGSGLCPFNRLETNHAGDVVTIQYTLSDIQSEYQKQETQNVSEVKLK